MSELRKTIATLMVLSLLLFIQFLLQPEFAKSAEPADGDIFVTELGAVVQIDPETGAVIERWESPSWQSLGGIATDAEGRILVIDQDSGTDELWRIDPVSGAQELITGNLDYGRDLVVAADGVPLVIERGDQAVVWIDTTTGQIYDLSVGGELNEPEALARNGMGAYVAANPVRWRPSGPQPEGGRLVRVEDDGTQTVVVDEFDLYGLTSVALQPGAPLAWLAQEEYQEGSDARLIAVDLESGIWVEVVAGDPFVAPRGLAIEPTGHLLVIEPDGRLLRYSVWNGVTTTVATGLDEPWGVTVYRRPCKDGMDNDGDGLVDDNDPGCVDAGEQSDTLPCDDGEDNDGDGKIDHTGDPGCAYDPENYDEIRDCDNGRDDDDDGTYDGFECYGPACPCTWGSHPNGVNGTACDKGCGSLVMGSPFIREDQPENPECSDGIDNDNDGDIDLDDSECPQAHCWREDGTPFYSPFYPTQLLDCVRPKGGGCGIGPELGFLAIPLWWLSHRRRRQSRQKGHRPRRSRSRIALLSAFFLALMITFTPLPAHAGLRDMIDWIRNVEANRYPRGEEFRGSGLDRTFTEGGVNLGRGIGGLVLHPFALPFFLVRGTERDVPIGLGRIVAMGEWGQDLVRYLWQIPHAFWSSQADAVSPRVGYWWRGLEEQ